MVMGDWNPPCCWRACHTGQRPPACSLAAAPDMAYSGCLTTKTPLLLAATLPDSA